MNVYFEQQKPTTEKKTKARGRKLREICKEEKMDNNNNEIIERQHQREAIDKEEWTTDTHIT